MGLTYYTDFLSLIDVQTSYERYLRTVRGIKGEDWGAVTTNAPNSQYLPILPKASNTPKTPNCA